MQHYQHDMMHCSQDKCKKKDQCYRYWLSKNFQGHGWTTASFYCPKEPVTEGCSYFVNKEYFD